MDRKEPFLVGEMYHVYNRGVAKQNIFRGANDWKHFQRLLFTRNSTKRIDSTRVKGLPLHKIDRAETIVDIAAYCLMPNHFHLLLRERVEDGISAFMGKLGTAFSMYFNEKYGRTGPLVCHPFRSKYVDDDHYLRWVFAYIHLNPVSLIQDDYKENGIKDFSKIQRFLSTYNYSSYYDYLIGERDESRILTSNEEVHSLLRDGGTLRGLSDMNEDVKGQDVKGLPFHIYE